jgi:hypothetical protein
MKNKNSSIIINNHKLKTMSHELPESSSKQKTIKNVSGEDINNKIISENQNKLKFNLKCNLKK